MPRIFISYRREDSNNIAGRIYDRLVDEFGKENIFKDVDSIPLGADFRHVLTRAVVRCDVVLSVIGVRWLDTTDRAGEKRLNSKSDFVRVEIEAALQRGIPVVPVLVDGASVPSPDDLPGPLKDLSFRNGTPVRYDPDFHRDMDRLVDWLRQSKRGRVPAQVSTEVKPTSSVRSCLVATLTAFLVIASLLGAWQWRTGFPGMAWQGEPKADDPGPRGQRKADAPAPYEKSITNTLGMKLALIPAGSFRMGADDKGFDEIPAHVVGITRPFYLGAHEVTQWEYEQVLGSNPSAFTSSGPEKGRVSGQDTNRFPVEMVSWLDSVLFCNTLSARENRSPYYRIGPDGETVTIAAGNGYRLPTEAEWEYACRAGTSATYSFGDDASELGDFAWFGENSGGHPHPVGEKLANAFGLFDMDGNVSEWCWDYYDDGYYPKSPADDPRNDDVALFRVDRGGTWFNPSSYARASHRFRNTPEKRYSNLGFRVARDPTAR